MAIITIDEMMKLLPNAYTMSDTHPNEVILNKGAWHEYVRVTKFCNDCRNMEPPKYRVAKELWDSAVKEPLCHLCLSCLDKRVFDVRWTPLQASDFDEGIPLNQGVTFGIILGQRSQGVVR